MIHKLIKIAAVAALLLSGVYSANAQSVEAQVGKIRQLYTETNAQIDAGIEDKSSGLHYASWRVGGEGDGMQWRAVGNMMTNDEFYFDCEPDNVEECGADVRKFVRKIVSSYEAAADLKMRWEYLFNEAGELIFAYQNELDDDAKNQERRFYFAKGKLIRVARGGKNIDAKFTADDGSRSREAVASAKRLKNLFALMFAE